MILIRFDKDDLELKARCQKINAHFTLSHKGWWVPMKDIDVKKIFDAFKDLAYIDYSAFSIKPSMVGKSEHLIKGSSRPSVNDKNRNWTQQIPAFFTDLLITKRYSESTIKTYTSLFGAFLGLKGEIGQHDKDELEEGILLVVYLLYLEIFEAEGWCYLHKNKLFDTVNTFLDSYSPDNDKKKELKNCIQFSRNNYENEQIGDQGPVDLKPKNKKLREKRTENDKWVHKTFVEEYFVDIANSFEPLRQKTKNFSDSVMKKGKK